MTDWLGPEEWEAIWLSLRVAGWSVGISLPIGVFLAWLLARRRFPGKTVLDGIVHLPLVLPPSQLSGAVSSCASSGHLGAQSMATGLSLGQLGGPQGLPSSISGSKLLPESVDRAST